LVPSDTVPAFIIQMAFIIRAEPVESIIPKMMEQLGFN
jgi:hypothetical protein